MLPPLRPKTTLELILEQLKMLGERQNVIADQLAAMARKLDAHQKENHKMLKVCHTGYTNILKAQEYTTEKFEECMDDCQDISNSVSNLGWG